MNIAEHKLSAAGSEFGVSLGGPEYDFLRKYIGFLISQNLVHANYSDLLIDIDVREMMPMFIVPLSKRGRELRDLISRREDEFVEASLIQQSGPRAAQEAFVEMVEASMLPRFSRASEVRRIAISQLS